MARRIADTFSLFYATAVLLRASGAVPKSFRTSQPVARAYRSCLEAMSPPASGRERLIALAKAPGVIDLRTEQLREMMDEEFKAVPAFLDVSEANELLLLMTVDGLARALRDYRFVLKDPEVRAMLIPDTDQDKRKHPIRKGKRDRMYCFNLGPIDASAATTPSTPDPTLFDADTAVDLATIATAADSPAKEPGEDQPPREFVSKRKAQSEAERQRATRERKDAKGHGKGAGSADTAVAAEKAGKVPKLKVGARVRVTNPKTEKSRIGEIVEVDARRARVKWRSGKATWVLRSKLTLAPKRDAA